jgi:YD repeat-containing protein
MDHAFLTSRIDPHGRIVRFIYDNDAINAVKLRHVVDVDGRTNTLTYANSSYPLQVTGVEDPFGNSASISYDHNGLLTNITDVVGLSSAVGYDGQGWITNLITPYGTTRFEHFTNFTGWPNEFGIYGDYYNNASLPVRAIRVVDPEYRTNVYMLKQDCRRIWTNYLEYPDPQYGEPFLDDEWADWATYPLEPYEDSLFDSRFDLSTPYWRNSFHWGPIQSSSLPGDLTAFSATDFLRARMRHWLHEEPWVIGQFLSVEREPSPDGSMPGQTTWYAYRFTKPGTYSQPPFAPVEPIPSIIARVLPDSTSAYTWFDRDEWGRATNIVSTYSTGFGQTPLTRTNSYIYSADGIDLLFEIGPDGHTNRSYVYDANHNLLRMTNAFGGVHFYTYDMQGLLTSRRTPAGLTTTNIYFSSGWYTNWVAATVDLEIGRTNSFTYENNLVRTHTDERGLTITNTWDALNRLRRVDYPDGTFVTNSYERLDLVRTVDRLGYPTSFTYDSVRRMIAKTNALGHFTLYQYCACAGLESMRDAEGNYTTYGYDSAGRHVQTTLPGLFVVRYNRNLLGQITNVTDSSGLNVTNWYNNQGLLYASSNGFGRVKEIAYDLEDRATNSIDANGIALKMSYDPAGRLRTRTYPDSGIERFGYSERGLIAYTNQIGMTNFYAYDAAGRKTFETNANWEVTQFRYDPSGNLTNLIDGRNQKHLLEIR